MTTEDEFQAQLDANPADWQTRLILADWLDDHPPECRSCRGGGRHDLPQVPGGLPCLACKGTGRAPDRAAGYRALGELQIRPLSFRMKTGPASLVWGYHSGTGVDPNTGRTASWRHALPPAWFRRAALDSAHVWVLFGEPAGRRQVEDCAAAAFGMLEPLVQKSLLAAGRSRLRCAAAMGV